MTQEIRAEAMAAEGRAPAGRNVGKELAFLFPPIAAMYSVFQGMQTVLLPTQVAAMSSDKVNTLAVLAAIGALVAALANPLAGTLSDRTRSRFGRRAPWLLVGSIAAALTLLLLGAAPQVFLLGAAYALVMLCMGCFFAVSNAIIPDRIPAERRGWASGVVGAGIPVGLLVGVNLVATAFTSPIAGYAVLGGLLVVTSIIYVVCTRDEPVVAPRNKAPRRPAGESVAEFFSSLRVSDFRWAFISRATFMLGFYGVLGYLLYTMQDYIDRGTIPGGNPTAAVATLTTINAVTMLVGTVAGGYVSDLLGRRKVIVFAAAVLNGVALLFPVFSPTFTAMLVMMLVLGFSLGTYLAVDTAILTLVLPDADANARDLGLLGLAQTGAQVASTFAAALVITLLGGYMALFIFSMVCSVLGALTIIPIRNVR